MKNERITPKNIFILGLLLAALFAVLTTRAQAQETVETGSDATTTEEATATTPEGIETAPTEEAAAEVARVLSAADLTELENARIAISNANAVFNHVLERIISTYQINVQTESLNIRTGVITPRQATQ